MIFDINSAQRIGIHAAELPIYDCWCYCHRSLRFMRDVSYENIRTHLPNVIAVFKDRMRGYKGDTKLLQISLSEREDNLDRLNCILETIKATNFPPGTKYRILTIPRKYIYENYDTGQEEHKKYNCYLITFTFKY